MEYDFIRKAYETRFNAYTPTAGFVKLFTNQGVNETATKSLVADIQFVSTDQITLGGTTNRYRIKGNFLVSVHVPKNSGAGAAMVEAEKLCTHFFKYEATEGTTYVRGIQPPALRPSPLTQNRYSVMVIVPFVCDFIS